MLFISGSRFKKCQRRINRAQNSNYLAHHCPECAARFVFHCWIKKRIETSRGTHEGKAKKAKN